MNDPVSKPSAGQPDALRRKLTKGGLAVPVILATLASKPVLAVPWTCSISGQLSGNVSGHAGEICTSVGNGLGYWQNQYKFGDPPTNFTGPLTPPPASLFPGLTNYFWVSGNSLLVSDTQPINYTQANINQILNLVGTGDDRYKYTHQAVVLLLNAMGNGDPSVYPLTEYQARKLYVAAFMQSSFSDTNPDFTWNYDYVKYYIGLLYHS